MSNTLPSYLYTMYILNTDSYFSDVCVYFVILFVSVLMTNSSKDIKIRWMTYLCDYSCSA